VLPNTPHWKNTEMGRKKNNKTKVFSQNAKKYVLLIQGLERPDTLYNFFSHDAVDSMTYKTQK